MQYRGPHTRPSVPGCSGMQRIPWSGDQLPDVRRGGAQIAALGRKTLPGALSAFPVISPRGSRLNSPLEEGLFWGDSASEDACSSGAAVDRDSGSACVSAAGEKLPIPIIPAQCFPARPACFAGRWFCWGGLDCQCRFSAGSPRRSRCRPDLPQWW